MSEHKEKFRGMGAIIPYLLAADIITKSSKAAIIRISAE